MSNPRWAYGITTVSERVQSGLLQRTLSTLRLGGFPFPYVFLDGGTESSSTCEVRGNPILSLALRTGRIGALGNWWLALVELYNRYPNATRFALFQDDVHMSRNLLPYLDRWPYPEGQTRGEEKGYWNLITYPDNVTPEMKSGKTGWYKAVEGGQGAQGLVFSRNAVMSLLSSIRLPEWVVSVNGKKNIDGVVHSAMKEKGWVEYVHNPSLISHVEGPSVIGNRSQPSPSSFMGEEFDLMSIAPDPSLVRVRRM